MRTSVATGVARRTPPDSPTARRLWALARRGLVALTPLAAPDGRFEARRRQDLRAFLALFLVFQIGYAIVGVATGGPGALAEDRMTALISGAGFAALAGLLLVVVLQLRSLALLELVGLAAGLACLFESLFGQLHNPQTTAAVTTYESIAIACVAFAVPWRPRFHHAWLAVAAVFGAVGVLAVPTVDERGPLAGALAFAVLIAVVSKPIVWNARVERHLQTMHVRRLNLELQVTARRDATTGCETRRALDEYVAHLAHRRGGRVGFAMVDADHFKQINDLLGHRAGDTALRRLSEELRASVRDADRSFRYGGEEFLVAFDPMPRSGVDEAAERIRAAVELAGIANPAAPTGLLTVSVGAVELDLPATEDGVLAAVAEADARMYLAKQAGRNRVRGEALGQ